MSQENYFTKLKELPESVRQFGGLIIITLIIILSFIILNKILIKKFIYWKIFI